MSGWMYGGKNGWVDGWIIETIWMLVGFILFGPHFPFKETYVHMVLDSISYWQLWLLFINKTIKQMNLKQTQEATKRADF